MLFLSYQTGRTPAVRQPTLLPRLWGNKHAHILLKGIKNGTNAVEENLELSSKITYASTL